MFTRMISSRLGRVVAVISLALSGGFACAMPMTYSIYQPGFGAFGVGPNGPGWGLGGGFVTGLFEGEDLNHDGFIELAAGELTRYEISFSGDEFIPAFSHSLDDLLYFNYTVGSSGFRPSFPLYSFGSGYSYDADDYIIGVQNYSRLTTTVSNATVSRIPAPATLFLVLPGLLFMALHARRGNNKVI